MIPIIIFLVISLIIVISIFLVKKIISQNKTVVENFNAHEHDAALISHLQKKINQLKN